MDLLIANAFAQQAPAAPPGSAVGFVSLLPIIALFVLFYFILLRPQMKRDKEHKKMIQSLAKGDEIVTSGGLLGRVTELGDHFVALEIAKDLEVKIQRQAISMTVPKGTIKTFDKAHKETHTTHAQSKSSA
jgi:preprotein translocase subunit YajC